MWQNIRYTLAQWWETRPGHLYYDPYRETERTTLPTMWTWTRHLLRLPLDLVLWLLLW